MQKKERKNLDATTKNKKHELESSKKQELRCNKKQQLRSNNK